MTQSTDGQIAYTFDHGRRAQTGRATARLLVIGGTRGAGRQVLRQALAAGYTVTALARDPARIDRRHERLTVLRGDVLAPDTLGPAMAGQDAVISTLGGSGRRPTTLYSDGMRHIIQAMRRAGVTRLVAVSAAPLGSDDGDTLPSRLLLKPLLRAVFAPLYADLARMEAEMRASGLAWTIVRPPRLTDTAPTGRYRTAINRGVRRGYALGRADLAHALLALLDDPRAIHATVGVGY